MEQTEVTINDVFYDLDEARKALAHKIYDIARKLRNAKAADVDAIAGELEDLVGDLCLE